MSYFGGTSVFSCPPSSPPEFIQASLAAKLDVDYRQANMTAAVEKTGGSTSSDATEVKKVLDALLHKREEQRKKTRLTSTVEKQVDDDSRLAIIRQQIEPPQPATMSRALQVRKHAAPAVAALPHPSWKLMRVVAGHKAVARCIAVDPSNQVFATGDALGEIKIWDVATSDLKMTLAKSHTHAVRGLAFSTRLAYFFSAGEDKEMRCWDLETGQVVRTYHGHTAAVQCIALHPTLDLLVSGARDASVRVWDIRTNIQVHAMVSHRDTVSCVATQAVDPQVISGSEDSTVRLWDLAAGKSVTTLTYHSKGVRALVIHPKELAFASASTASMKKFALPNGRFVMDFPIPTQAGIVNTLALSRDDVLVAGTQTSSKLRFWDWRSASPFQELPLKAQPGSLPSENFVAAASFDVTGSRLMTCNGDKSIQVFKEFGT